MLQALRFVRGSVSSSDIVPILSSYLIKDGSVVGYNGRMSLGAPIDLTFETSVEGAKFYAAILACKKETEISMTEAGRLAVRSGGFRAYLRCFEDKHPARLHPIEDGITFVPPSDFLDTLQELRPFISEDASRQWSVGLLFHDGHAYATNNIHIARRPISGMPDMRVNIPIFAVDEMMRIKEDPIEIRVADKLMSVLYSGGRWLTTCLLSSDWPDVEKFFEEEVKYPVRISQIIEAVLTIYPFLEADKRVVMEGKVISSPDSDKHKTGAAIDIDVYIPRAIFNADMLLKFKDLEGDIDLTKYPLPCPFRTSGVDGVMIGMRG